MRLNNEIYEEFGIEIQNIRLIAISSGEGHTVQYPNGDILNFINFLFLAEYKCGELRPNDSENTEVKWVSIEQLEHILLEDHRVPLEIYKKYKGDIILI